MLQSSHALWHTQNEIYTQFWYWYTVQSSSMFISEWKLKYIRFEIHDSKYSELRQTIDYLFGAPSLFAKKKIWFVTCVLLLDWNDLNLTFWWYLLTDLWWYSWCLTLFCWLCPFFEWCKLNLFCFFLLFSFQPLRLNIVWEKKIFLSVKLLFRIGSSRENSQTL